MEIKVEITKNGPIHISGEDDDKIIVENSNGNKVKWPPDVWLCRCGKSKNKPYCDGSHRKGFDDEV